MNNIEIQGGKLKPIPPHYSSDSASILSEVQANMIQHDERSAAIMPVVSDSTAGDEGWLDTVTDEPEVSSSDYPFPQQQPYIYWGIAAFMLVAGLVLISILDSQH